MPTLSVSTTGKQESDKLSSINNMTLLGLLSSTFQGACCSLSTARWLDSLTHASAVTPITDATHTFYPAVCRPKFSPQTK